MDEPLWFGEHSTKLRVRLLVVDQACTDQSVIELFPEGIHVEATGAFTALRVDPEHVEIEDESGLILGLEPVDVVLVVGDTGGLAGAEPAIDRGPDDHVVLLILHPVVVTPMEVTLQDEERRGHVVMAVGYHGSTLPERENLLTEDEALRDPIHSWKARSVAPGPIVDEIGMFQDFVKVDEIGEFLEIDLRGQKVFDLLLPLDRLHLLVFQVEPGLVDLIEPLDRGGLDLLGQEVG